MKHLNIRKERQELGMKQREVGQIIGVSKVAIHDIETGKQKPSYDVLVKLENLFGKTHRYLLAQEGDESQGNFNTTSNSGGSHSIAAAELSEVKSSEMVKASEDLQDGRADTPEGEKVLRLMRQTGGAALAVI